MPSFLSGMMISCEYGHPVWPRGIFSMEVTPLPAPVRLTRQDRF